MIIYNVNLLAVIIAAIASFIIGALWYSQVLFGKYWAKLSGLDKEEAKDSIGKSMLYDFLATLVKAYILAVFIVSTGFSTALNGIIVGILIWLGFIGTTLLGSVIWEKKPFQFYLINSGAYLVSFIVMGAILGAFS